MAELTTGERLQPSLLDRLTDNDPDNLTESRDQRVMSLQQIRDAVQRDLAALMNCCSMSTTENLDDFPDAAKSVINYGVADLSGASVIGANISIIERRIHGAICNFEPRILPDSLRIQVVSDPSEMNDRSMVIQIEGKLWSQPMPLRLYWNTEVDLDTGDVVVAEGGR